MLIYSPIPFAGFVGLLLARSPSALDSIHRVGPLGVLKAVGLPSDISM